MMPTPEKLLEKITKLQAMAERGTRQEAEIAAGKISALLLRHNLTMGDVVAHQHSKLTEADIEVSGERWEQNLAAATATAHLCGAVASHEPNMQPLFRFFGREDNVAVATHVFSWLVGRVMTTARQALYHQTELGDWYVLIDPLGWTHAYRCGMVDGIIAAFRRARGDLDENEEMALVPLNQEIEAHRAEHYPEAKPPTISEEIDARAYRAGYQAGLDTPMETQIGDEDARAALDAAPAGAGQS